MDLRGREQEARLCLDRVDVIFGNQGRVDERRCDLEKAPLLEESSDRLEGLIPKDEIPTFLGETGNRVYSFTRETYWPVRVSRRRVSPSSMNRGT